MKKLIFIIIISLPVIVKGQATINVNKFLREVSTSLQWDSARNGSWKNIASQAWTIDYVATHGGGGGGSGTVTTVSGVNTNGFTFSIANSSTTPAITLTLQNGAADGSTKGQAGFTASDFNSSTGIISIDYTNGQKATESVPGFMTAGQVMRLDSNAYIHIVKAPSGYDSLGWWVNDSTFFIKALKIAAPTGITVTPTSTDSTLLITFTGTVSLTGTEILTNKTLTSSTNVLGGVTMTMGSDGNYDVYYRNSSGILTRLAAGTDGYFLTTHSTSSAPTWTAASGGVSDGDKGDITVSSSGTVWTVDNGAITYAKIQNVAAYKTLGNATGSAAAPAEIRVPVVVATGTFSGATTAAFDFTTWYNQFDMIEIQIYNMTVSNHYITLGLQTSTDASTYHTTSGDYKYAYVWRAGTRNEGDFVSTEIRLTDRMENAATIPGAALSGYIRVYEPSNASNRPHVIFNFGYTDGDGNYNQANGSGAYITAQVTKAIRFITGSGNCAGSYAIIGYKLQ